MENTLDSAAIAQFLTVVEEATRSSKEGVRFFVEPADGTLRRATARRHHVIFGRRGSGKSSLLQKAAADLTIGRRPIAWVDIEPFKNHSYPDVLLSILIRTFEEFKHWLETAAVAPATKTSFWNRLFGAKPTKKPFNRSKCRSLVSSFADQIETLKNQLHSADGAVVKVTEASTSSNHAESSISGGLKTPVAGASGAATSASSSAATNERQETFQRTKIDFLRRHVLEYQAIFDEMASVSDGDSYLFLDDLYHLRRADQPSVIDYFHSVGKGHNLWIKVGTIRHRTDWYIHGNPPIGVKLGDDADEIDLDLTLEKYAITKKFLSQILRNLAVSSGVQSVDTILTSGALDRLVLASGGVARDFLSILRRSIGVGRERDVERVGAEEVNVAAGEYDSSKREEFKRDTQGDDETPLDEVFKQVRKFCVDSANSNCFLVDKDAKGRTVDAIHELVDLKLLHLVRSRVTVPDRQGRIFEAYMLDLSQYAGARTKRGLELIEFWKEDSKEKLRRASLILEPGGGRNASASS